MKLSRLYSNLPERFAPINFAPGLNVILGEIRVPANRKKDTHNLGKTTLGRLIDFCLLSKTKSSFFLTHHAQFAPFVFFLELELRDGSFLTIRRGVKGSTKISVKRHAGRGQDYTALPDSDWDHAAVPLERAKILLDGILDLQVLAPWNFRKLLGYLIRTQDDFQDVFHLRRFQGKHAEWKPFLAHLLGFDAGRVLKHYQLEEQLAAKKTAERAVERELGGSVVEGSRIDGLLLLKRADVEKKQSLLDTFDFRQTDMEKTRLLVDDLNARIASLNEERYTLTQSKRKIAASLSDDEILFDAEKAAVLFAEAGVFFAGQLKRDFTQLVRFNRAITEERRGYLQEELAEIEKRLAAVGGELHELGSRRAATLAFLRDADVFAKYKQVSDELSSLRADILFLEKQRSAIHRLQELRSELRALTEQVGRLQAEIEQDVEKQNAEPGSTFSTIRVYFNEIVEAVINRKALLSVTSNQEGHLEFKAEILDDSGNSTSADRGYNYRKLLCVALDLALLRAHQVRDGYPAFVFHDGVFESWDDRKKENLLGVLRDYALLGLQPIITLIDSDLPANVQTPQDFFLANEIVLTLHDENQEGRLFKMATW